jgi:EAL domain-containing protein (putative c-di-GMP-specific phosphodiesterase class I)/GGDEF domain-containing protein
MTTAPRAFLLSDSADGALAEAAQVLQLDVVLVRPASELPAAIDAHASARVVVVSTDDPALLRTIVEHAGARRIPIVLAGENDVAYRRAIEFRVDDWYVAPATPAEIAWRIRSALARVAAQGNAFAHRIDKVEYEEMLYDPLTGMPTLPVMLERTRGLIKDRGEVIVYYLNFVRYSKIEEIYGWEKLDQVLETTSAAVREFLDSRSLGTTRMMVGFANDDDFIFLQIPEKGKPVPTDAQITEVGRQLQLFVGNRLDEVHGEDVASLFDIYIGSSHVYYTPKIRFERLIYRGVREAANAARSVEQRERVRRTAALKSVLHEGAVYIDFHPIVLAETGEIFGYEALARGVPRNLRSPEVMFEVAAEADLVWELSRLCRARALAGAKELLQGDQLLFVNVDPHDFADPGFGVLDSIDPRRIVLEITERTAIKDYPKFRERLRSFRERGFRFAVDDAGSGYAGLGSIANLEPDFIKLDISLINSIDTNFIKQNLVETMVVFAREQGAMVIAEGIERPEELETVKRIGVPLVQGFLLHHPARAGAVAGALSRGE